MADIYFSIGDSVLFTLGQISFYSMLKHIFRFYWS